MKTTLANFKMNKIAILCFLTLGLIFSACTTQDTATKNNSSTITIQPNEKKPMNEQEKKELLDKLKTAADKDDAAAFANTLAQVYENRWEGDKDLAGVESAFYMKWTNNFLKGQTSEALKIAETITEKVPTGWRFKYLKIRVLEKLGLDAFNAGDLIKAKEYATKIMSIEYRPEGVNLMAKVLLNEAQAALKANKKDEARKLVHQALEMDIPNAELKQQLEQLQKSLGE